MTKFDSLEFKARLADWLETNKGVILIRDFVDVLHVRQASSCLLHITLFFLLILKKKSF